MSLTLHWHPISQPSRAIKHFLDIAGIEHEIKTYDFFAGEHKKDEGFMRVSPQGTLPTL